MINEAQSHEAISDSFNIGLVIAGTSQTSMREHLLLGATKCDSWPNFVREVETIEHAKRTISAPTPMEMDAFQGVCHKCEKHCQRMSEFDPRRGSLNARSVEKDFMDSVGHEVTHQQQENHRKEDGKVLEKVTVKEHRRVESSKAAKEEPNGKVRERERKINVSTNSTARRTMVKWILGTVARTVMTD